MPNKLRKLLRRPEKRSREVHPIPIPPEGISQSPAPIILPPSVPPMPPPGPPTILPSIPASVPGSIPPPIHPSIPPPMTPPITPPTPTTHLPPLAPPMTQSALGQPHEPVVPHMMPSVSIRDRRHRHRHRSSRTSSSESDDDSDHSDRGRPSRSNTHHRPAREEAHTSGLLDPRQGWTRHASVSRRGSKSDDDSDDHSDRGRLSRSNTHHRPTRDEAHTSGLLDPNQQWTRHASTIRRENIHNRTRHEPTLSRDYAYELDPRRDTAHRTRHDSTPHGAHLDPRREPTVRTRHESIRTRDVDPRRHESIRHQTRTRALDPRQETRHEPPRTQEVQMRDLDPRLESTPYYSRCTGRRKALCIGINYIGQKDELKGCINDASNVRRSLIKQFNYPEDSIVILWDESPYPSNMPTRKNILAAMRWLVEGAQPHDSLFFHYSGHGSQVPDKTGDELDRQDEVIFPVDFKQAGVIKDDEMHEVMVKNLPARCRLTALFDSCHSGTVLDLPYIYCDLRIFKHLRMQRAVLKAKRTEADVISWCSSKSSEKSVDTFVGGVAVGAMSHAFLDCLQENPTQSYRGLLNSIKKKLVKYEQTPQLGSAHRMDTSRQFIM